MKRFVFALVLLFPFSTFIPVSQAAYYSAEDENPSINSEINDDAFIAGNSLSINAPVLGELFGAGNTVYIGKKAARSIYAAGNTVTIDQGADYNAFVAGNTVTLAGTYGHDVYAAGSSVTIKEGTVIRGDLRVAAANLVLNGTVEGDVYVGASSVMSSATINGEMKTETESLTFTGGRIGKDLTYYTEGGAKGLDKVTVAGKTVRAESRIFGKANKETEKFSLSAFLFGSWVFNLLGALLLGAILILLTPKKVEGVSEEMTKSYSESMITGIIAMIVIPIIIVLAFTTLIGWKVALLLLGVYMILMTIAGTVGTMWLGKYILKRTGRENASWWLALAAGVVLIAILQAVPFLYVLVNVVVFILLTLPAFGAMLRWYRHIVA